MDWLRIFRGDRKNTAQTAKDRLMIAVAHQRRGDGNGLRFLPQMRQELLNVVRKYIEVPDDSVQFTVQREDGLEILELNITLPEDAKKAAAQR